MEENTVNVFRKEQSNAAPMDLEEKGFKKEGGPYMNPFEQLSGHQARQE